MIKRTNLDRRKNDRREQNIAVSVEKRISLDKRSGIERRKNFA